MNNNIQIPHNIFGSKNSIDTDIMVEVPSISTIQESKLLVFDLEMRFNVIDNINDPNINLCVINDGIVVDVFKGTPDEVNNSIFETYNYHDNTFPIFVTKKVKRDVIRKVFRMSRVILSFLSRTNERTKVKELLKIGSLKEQLNFLSYFSFNNIEDKIHDKYENVEVLKTLFFQLSQTYHLLCGNEYYCKDLLIDNSSEITRKAINREKVSLNKVTDEFQYMLNNILIELADNKDYKEQFEFI